MHQSIPPAPIPPAPTGWPPGISIFFYLGWQIPGSGDSWAVESPRVGTKKEGKCPVLRQHCNLFAILPFFANAPPPGLTWRANAPQWPWGEGGGLGAGGIDWCITEQHILTTTDQSFPYQKAIKAYAYVITRRQHLINNFNLFSDFIFSDNGC